MQAIQLVIKIVDKNNWLQWPLQVSQERFIRFIRMRVKNLEFEYFMKSASNIGMENALLIYQYCRWIHYS